MKVKESVCSHWRDIATHLHFSSGLMETIRTSNAGPEEAFDDVMTQWLNGTEGTLQPISWRTSLGVLRDINHNTLAMDLEEVLADAV